MRDAIVYIGLAQSLFAVLVLVTKKRVLVSDRILIFCLLTIAAKFLVHILSREYPQSFDVDLSMPLIPMTFGPYLYLYTDYILSGRRRFRPLHYLHFAPLLIVYLTYLPFFHGEMHFDEVAYFEKDRFLWIRMIYAVAFLSSVVIYTGLTFLKLSEYRKGLRTGLVSESNRLNMGWLSFITLLFCLIFLIYFIAGGINAVTFSRRTDMEHLSQIGLTILAYAISYFGLRQPFSDWSRAVDREEVMVEIKEEKQRTEANGNHSRSGRFSPKEAESLVERLDELMVSSKPYLNSELTLRDLAAKMKISRYELTELLNSHIGKNFFTYVNEYRLQEAIRMLEDPKHKEATIMAIAYDCGFNSKSTFNSLFKQYTRQTPSAYKKSKGEAAGANDSSERT